MSQTISTSPMARGLADPGRDKVRARQIVKRVIGFLTSMRVALILLLVLSLLTLAGTLIAQAPADVRGDPQAYSAWLDAMRDKYGGWAVVFDKVGLFTIFQSIWFKGAILLLAASLLACSARRAPRLWRQAARPPMVMKPAFFERVPQRATFPSEADSRAALRELRAAFRSHGYRTAVEQDGDDVHVCADRFRWAPMGRVAAHLGLVVILMGAVIGMTSGFRNEQFTVPVGSKVDVGNGTDIAVEAKTFSDSYYPSGQPREFKSELVIYDKGRQVQAGAVRVNHPMSYGGVKFYQSFFGAVANMRVKAKNGDVLFNKGVPLLWGSKDGTDRIGQFSLPEQGLTVFVVGPASGQVDPRIKAGQMQLEVYRSEDEPPVAVRVVSQGKTAEIAGLDFTFAREGQFTGLIVAHDPGTMLIWIGSALLTLGIAAAFFFPHRRIRAVVRRDASGSHTKVAGIAGRRDPDFRTQFQRLVDDIELALAGRTSTERGT